MPSAFRTFTPALAALLLNGCAGVGTLMSPYSEKFSCKNDDHGQCIHPDQAYADAVAGRVSNPDPAVTNKSRFSSTAHEPVKSGTREKAGPVTAFAGYRDSVYQELQALIDQPVTPMLKPAQAIRTLILPYADRQRPDRLYMPRYVYAILDRPAWVVGGYLVDPLPKAVQAPVLGQVREPASTEDAVSVATGDEPKK